MCRADGRRGSYYDRLAVYLKICSNESFWWEMENGGWTESEFFGEYGYRFRYVEMTREYLRWSCSFAWQGHHLILRRSINYLRTVDYLVANTPYCSKNCDQNENRTPCWWRHFLVNWLGCLIARLSENHKGLFESMRTVKGQRQFDRLRLVEHQVGHLSNFY